MPPITDPKAKLNEVAQELQKRKAATVQPSVSANDLANPVPPVNPPIATPPEPSGRVGSLIGNVTRDTQGFITNQSAEAQKARELAGLLGQDTGSAADFRTQQNEQYGIPENLKQLQDIQLQLADRSTETKVQNTRIGAAPGQTLNQAGREITQNDREAAIRDAGLAARASVLQGNIETASTLVSQAVQDFTADRSFKNQQMIQQLSYFQGLADEQTGQLLEQEKRKYEEDQANIERMQDAVDAAMASGAATEADIAQLTNPKLTDEERLAIAQGVVSRGAGELRNLSMEAQRASIAQSRASTANIYDQIASRQTALREAALNATTEEEAIKAQLTADSEQALSIKSLAEDLKNEAGLNDAVGVGFKKSVVGSIPFVSGDAIEGTARADFEAKATRLGDLLTLDNLDLMKGVLTDKDIQILANAGSNLKNFDMSEKAYNAEIDRIVSTMNRTISNNGITPEQASFWGVLAPSDVDTFNSLWETL